MKFARDPASSILLGALLATALGGWLAPARVLAQAPPSSPGGAPGATVPPAPAVPATAAPATNASASPATPDESPAIHTAESVVVKARTEEDAAYAAVEALVNDLQDDYVDLTTGPEAAAHLHVLVLAMQDSLETARTRLAAEVAKGKAVLRGTRRQILADAFAAPVAAAAPVDARLCAWIADRVAEALSARENLEGIGADDLLGIIRGLLPPDVSWYRFWNDRFHAGLPETDRLKKADDAYLAAGLALDRLKNPERYGARGQEAPPGMVIVPGGSYEIGPDTGWERPQRRVTLKVFAIDRHEVTQAEYALYVNTLPDKERAAVLPRGWSLDEKGLAKFDQTRSDHPVNYVDWKLAAGYAAWAGKRLPTEDEWEAAAGGVNAHVYPWGDEWKPGRAQGGEDATDTMPVESCPDGRATCGALDLSGNVWEWTATLENGDTIKELPEGMVNVVIRGGGFNSRREELTTRYRWTAPGHEAFASARYTRPIGFRCVKDLP